MIRIKWKKIHGEVQLAGFEVYLDPKMRDGFGRGFPLMSWQEEFLKGKRITPNAIGYFKKIFKNFPQMKKTFVLSPHKMEKPPRPKIKSWVNPNKTLVIKENF